MSTEQPILMPFQDEPFNGDIHACEEFIRLKEMYQIKYAIETGSCFYSTTQWLADNFEQVFTVEINPEFAKHGKHKIAQKNNVCASMGDSVAFLNEMKGEPFAIPDDAKCIYFLDAHWNEHCPLLEELDAIAHIKQAPPVIVIHDFYTANIELGYDSYNGQDFNWDFIKHAIYVLELEHNCSYEHHYNTEATGAKRGIIYITPKLTENELG